MSELVELYRKKESIEREIDLARLKAEGLKLTLDAWKTLNASIYYVDRLEISEAEAREQFWKHDLEVINKKIRMKECSFRILIGCDKCPYSGDCYEEECLLKARLLVKDELSIKPEIPIDYEEEFRRALPVVGE